MGYRGNFFNGKLQTKNADYTLLYSHRRAKGENRLYPPENTQEVCRRHPYANRKPAIHRALRAEGGGREKLHYNN